ncbi:MAG: hypothetical protein ACRDRU_25615 [Pseudonocardiaceae bacterium]
MSEPVSMETRINRNANDLAAIYGLIEEFAGQTRTNFAKVNQRFDDLRARLTVSPASSAT